LIDAAHADLQQSVAQLLTSLGWTIRVEASFNHYGDRGRVDILAFRPNLRVLLVVEIKSALGDLQDTLGRLDVKMRVGRLVAHDVGWGEVRAVIPALVIGDSRLARRTVANHESLFARYDLRGRGSLAWIRRPLDPWPTGLLWFVGRPISRQATGTRRLRAPKRSASRPV
jgi:hypothetical protein